MKALIFDCDGVILESEDIHRRSFNSTFRHFNVKCKEERVVEWDQQFYDKLQVAVDGGKPKMRFYFGRNGWPTSSVLDGRAPADEQEQAQLIDALQEWKSDVYRRMIGDDEVEPRPGVLRLMDEARAAGLKVGVCSAKARSGAAFVLTSVLGEERFQGLDVFVAGDDADEQAPDPAVIYARAAKALEVAPEDCVVVEDSMVGLKAAKDAGMRCIVTYTRASKNQTFPGAERIVGDLGSDPAIVTLRELQEKRIVQDDRIEMSITDSGVYFHIPGM